MALTDNIVAYWSFDESSGNAYSRYDGNTLTNVNSTSFAAGKKNNAASLAKASSNYFQLNYANQTGFGFTSDFTLSFWIKLTSQPTGAYPYYHLMNRWDENQQRSFSLTYSALSDPYIYMAISKTGVDSSDSDVINFDTKELTNDTWFHIVIGWDASAYTGYCYVNGSLFDTATGTQHHTSMYDSTANFLIGGHTDPENPLHGCVDGMFDETGVWSRLLTSDEVTELYNDGNPKYIFSNLVGVSQMSGISTITI